MNTVRSCTFTRVPHECNAFLEANNHEYLDKCDGLVQVESDKVCSERQGVNDIHRRAQRMSFAALRFLVSTVF